MQVDPNSFTPLYRQVADLLRAQIEEGELRPGDKLKNEDALAEEFGTGKATVRQALRLLRAEGLIDTENRRGSTVRKPPELTVVSLEKPARITARMPTAKERTALSVPEGEPVLVITYADGRTEVLARSAIDAGPLTDDQ
ncbi:GntR family transcriptional regulator [Nonomuraea africana]|uniref:DNA-binding GntR family transcriptional regulator n=1 Tax=Nonomuraea africana TaxID=46171 RepID=A0ABR9KQ96_9ACTN|nr:GntR family transcriptional regulator [Nonomuraea africana]MBE1564197.1 DNA-binding GntR family transcriptional regulator [Nonomuraea africana]